MPKVTKDSVKNVVPEWEYTDQRVSPGGYDEGYIAAYCKDPKAGKTAALRNAGCPETPYIRQQAYQIHKRLREEIEKRLDDAILDGAHLGHNVLVHLAKESDSDTVKATCAKNLIDYAGRKAGERLTVKNEVSEDQLDEEIERLQNAIRDQEGTTKRLDS